MNVKRFRQVSRGVSIILTIIICLLVVGLLSALFALFYDNHHGFEFTYNAPDFVFFMSTKLFSGNSIEKFEKTASLIVFPLFLLVNFYELFKGVQLFNHLAAGETPFQLKFARDIKRIAFVAIISDILSPIIYSLVLSILIPRGYQFSLGLTSHFFFGLLLYLAAEILNYGIELQQLADETV